VTATAGPETRDVIPRWRSVRDTIAGGEFPTGGSAVLTAEQEGLLQLRAAEWQTHATEVFAVEFVGTALLLGVGDRAADAAEFLAKNATLPSTELLGQLTTDTTSTDQAKSVQQHSDRALATERNLMERSAKRVAQCRVELDRDPRNAIAWSELARAYTRLGLDARAERAMRVALSLAPTSRYLLRAAACLYANIGQPEQGHAILTAAALTPDDPWLLAAELATANAADISPRFSKRARLMVERREFAPFQLSELASELGTLDLGDNDRRAKKFFHQALAEPTENSVAQAEWASHRISGLLVPDARLYAPMASEARARHAQQEGEWRNAFGHATAWLGDQLFSTNAAIAASYVSTVGLDDYAQGLHAARIGLIAHPRDAGLLNNAAYSMIELGDLEKAEELLRRIDFDTASDIQWIPAVATQGLLAFRRRRPEVGRELYHRAIELAHSIRGKETTETMATLMLAREELTLDPVAGRAALAEAERLSRRVRDASVDRWLPLVQRVASAPA